MLLLAHPPLLIDDPTARAALTPARKPRPDWLARALDEPHLSGYACTHHTDGLTEAEPTVQACWDADRLDLPRVGIWVDPDRLCAVAARDPELIRWAEDRAIHDHRPDFLPDWMPFPRWPGIRWIRVATRPTIGANRAHRLTPKNSCPYDRFALAAVVCLGAGTSAPGTGATNRWPSASGAGLPFMHDLPIPDSPAAVTAEWLSAALRASTTTHAGTVTALTSEPLGVSTAAMCRLARIRPTYDVPEPNAPRSIILKLNDVDASGRPSFSNLNAAEIGFYTQIAPTATLGSPRCYHAAFDEASGRSVLLLEDLAELRTADWIEGLGAADAEAVVRHLAGFHAAWWESPRLAEFGWVRRLDGPETLALFRQASQRARTEVRSDTDPIERKTLENFEFIRRQVGSRPRTIVHNDLHAQNLFFRVAADRPELVLIDFNAIGQARGPRDIAGLLGTSMESGERLATESALLRTYHATLLQAGVSDYSLEHCLHDYRIGLLFSYARTLLSVAMGLAARNQMEERYRVMLARERAAIDDNDCAALLPG